MTQLINIPQKKPVASRTLTAHTGRARHLKVLSPKMDNLNLTTSKWTSSSGGTVHRRSEDLKRALVLKTRNCHSLKEAKPLNAVWDGRFDAGKEKDET